MKTDRLNEIARRISSELSLTPEERKKVLAPPPGRVPIVLDTDAKNEIDDQFAIVYALLSPQIECRAIYAAPFVRKDPSGGLDGEAYPDAKSGMEASYDEIHAVLDVMDFGANAPSVLKGSDAFCTQVDEARPSPAVEDLIKRCMSSKRVYVVAIGALTNVASALFLEPRIARRMVVVWLGGQPEYWDFAREFNLAGDLHATQLVLDSGVPLVRIPCKNVAEHVRTVPVELDAYFRPCGRIGEYLSDLFRAFLPVHSRKSGITGPMRSKVLWDIVPIAWLIRSDWVPTRHRPTPSLRDDLTWDLSDSGRPLYTVAIGADRDQILYDFLQQLKRRSKASGLASEFGGS